MPEQNSAITGNPTTITGASSPVALSDILKLMDETGLNFVLHTHHPATHLEYGNQISADPWANTRRECPEAPVAIQTGGGAIG